MNRVVRWTTEGWEMEPDQRHVDLIIKELGLSEAKPVSTPGEHTYTQQKYKRTVNTQASAR